MAYVGSGGNRQTDTFYTSGGGTGNTRETARVAENASNNTSANWGSNASRSLYSVSSNLGGKEMKNRDLFKSRLWKGVPQLTTDQLKAFEAAYTGHQFFFVIDAVRFMTQGYYKDTNLHALFKNLKSIIERASVEFSGPSNITAEFDDQTDGNGRKMSHMTRVSKEQNNITLRLHEFAGLPVKNAIEAWLTGVYDPYSEHGNYHGNLGITGGWCTANHTMSMLVVQVDPSWTEIQDAAYYYNMMPTEVPFDHMQWTKGEHTIIQDYDIEFNCNEFRGPSIMYAAEKFMNARILSMVSTSVFNSRQFVPSEFKYSTTGDLAYNGYKQEIGIVNDNGAIIDSTQFNTQITGTNKSGASLVEGWDKNNTYYKNEYNEEKEPDSPSPKTTTSNTTNQ